MEEPCSRQSQNPRHPLCLVSLTALLILLFSGLKSAPNQRARESFCGNLQTCSAWCCRTTTRWHSVCKIFLPFLSVQDSSEAMMKLIASVPCAGYFNPGVRARPSNDNGFVQAVCRLCSIWTSILTMVISCPRTKEHLKENVATFNGDGDQAGNLQRILRVAREPLLVTFMNSSCFGLRRLSPSQRIKVQRNCSIIRYA